MSIDWPTISFPRISKEVLNLGESPAAGLVDVGNAEIADVANDDGERDGLDHLLVQLVFHRTFLEHLDPPRGLANSGVVVG